MTHTAKLHAEAINNMNAALAAYQAAKTKTARQNADEDRQFWSNKAAMLEVMVQQGR